MLSVYRASKVVKRIDWRDKVESDGVFQFRV